LEDNDDGATDDTGFHGFFNRQGAKNAKADDLPRGMPAVAGKFRNADGDGI
jgi:hypothetical protein